LVESGLRPLRPTPAAKSLTMGLLGYYWTQIYPANSIANAFQIVWGNFAQYIVHIGWKRWPLSYQPRVDGIAYFLNCFCYSDQYHLQVLRPIHWTTHCVDRSVHSIRNENSFRKRQYCDAVCVCKLKGGNFKVAVKIISPQASNCNTSYMKDQVFSILDESYATSSGTMTLIIILVLCERNALRLVYAVGTLFSTLSYTWPPLCYIVAGVVPYTKYCCRSSRSSRNESILINNSSVQA
jgi:hypothetical protein